MSEWMNDDDSNNNNILATVTHFLWKKKIQSLDLVFVKVSFWAEELMFKMCLRAFPLVPLLSFMRHHLKYPAHPHEGASSDS